MSGRSLTGSLSRKMLREEKGRDQTMYRQVSADLHFVEREKAVEQFWKENHIFEKSIESRKEGQIGRAHV